MFEATFKNCQDFRKIIDAIKELAKNVNIDASPNGISIQAMDTCHIALVGLELSSQAFSSYKCVRPFTMGIIIQNVGKILKIAGSDDSLTISCQEEPTQLRFRFESKTGDKISQFNLSLIDMDSEGMGIPDTQFKSICNMPSSQFSRITKEFNTFSDCIKIQTSKQSVRFSVVGQIGSGSSILKQKQSENLNQAVELDIDEPVSQVFAARYLSVFSRAGSLSAQVSLNMSPQTPLMVLFNIMEGKGRIKYYLAPKISQDEL